MAERRIEPLHRCDATVTVPGDKSISHRALLVGAVTHGRSYIGNLSPAADVAATAGCLQACGVWLRASPEGRVSIEGSDPGRALQQPPATLDCANSGTTMRLLAGMLAGHDLDAVLDGDASLRRRPMERVAAPLREMGASVTTEDGRAPLRVRGAHPLRGIDYTPPVASAQLKSAVLLAALHADSETRIREAMPTRDHTERLLRRCGAAVRGDETGVTLQPGARLEPFGLRVPGDLSAAAFFLALAAARPSWRVRCPGVTLNPGRTGVLDALRAMGAEVTIEASEPAAGVEPCGDVEVRGAPLRGGLIDGALVPRCVDELPVLAVLATQCEGDTRIAGAAELRVKESDRIATVVAGLRALGADVDELEDGMVVHGPARLRGARLHAHGDHRLAMAWTVAGLLATEACVVDGAEVVAVSHPSFFEAVAALRLRDPG